MVRHRFTIFALALGVSISAMGFSTQMTPESPRLLVKLRPLILPASDLEPLFISSEPRRFRAELSTDTLRKRSELGRWYFSSEESAKTLSANEAVELVEAETFGEFPEIRVEDAINAEIDINASSSEPTTSPSNDSKIDKQWHLDRIGAPTIWKNGTTESRAHVFVLDSGAQVDHPDLALYKNSAEIDGNGIDDDQNGLVDDIWGWDFDRNKPDIKEGRRHGTHVAGIIAAAGNNKLLLSGVTWKSKVTVLKLAHGGRVSAAKAARAITFAVDNGASVINMSWRLIGKIPAYFDEAIAYAASADVVLVSTAGNIGRKKEQWPCNYKEVICVGSSNRKNEKALRSNYGPWVDLVAPGTKILSLWPKRGTKALSGTSMAAPQVSAAAAVLRTLRPSLSANDIRETLRESATDLGPVGPDEKTGYGLLNLPEAVRISSQF